MGPSRPLFVRLFFMTQMKYKLIKANLDGVLGTRTGGGMMEDAEKSTDKCRHPFTHIFSLLVRSVNLNKPYTC